jgi:hypothetical protein
MQSDVGYEYESGSCYRIDGYDEAPGFCSFLPGVAGLNGVPLWCMYVNRAQAVVSFGVSDKDHPIAEFLPATWAYQLVSTQGFRTFCRVNGAFYEPFQRVGDQSTCSRSMRIEADRLSLREEHFGHGLAFGVRYWGLVNRPVPALVRELRITNSGASPLDVEVLDGLPVIQPAGVGDAALKQMRHITEAYAQVRLLAGGVPYYATKVQTHDEAEVREVTDGNFYAGWVVKGNRLEPVEPIVDPDIVFGDAADLLTPYLFVREAMPDRDAQVWENRLACALVPCEAHLAPGQSLRLFSLAGHAPAEGMVEHLCGEFATAADFEAAASESGRLMSELTRPAWMVSAEPVLDAYARQNYLDNVLRGGIPVMLPSEGGDVPVHVYSRRHGDLERDYNYFVLPPYPLSSGAGNYRDICQNRRCDVWFYPEVADSEIRAFLGLIQADGYNPLGISGYLWQVPEGSSIDHLCPSTDARAVAEFRAIAARPFAPGELAAWCDRHAVDLRDRDDWLRGMLSGCPAELTASGHEGGYWTDHWTYIVDLLEAYAGIWPERVRSMLTERADVGWFDEGACVLPRREKYMRRAAGPLQLGAVGDGEPRAVPLPPVTPFGKLCALLALKAVSLDSAGRGIEMEAGRPGWNDSMNGLPGLFGSSTCETAEAARLALWLRDEVFDPPDTLLPIEVADFVEQVVADLECDAYDWDRAASLRETFRERLHVGASAELRNVPGRLLGRLLAGVQRRMLEGVEGAVAEATGLMHTYYRAEPLDAAPSLGEDGRERVDPATGSPLLEITSFAHTPLPLFLEGQVHRLRLLKGREDEARQVYEAVRASGMFDEALQMYKMSECLASEPAGIGRARTFSRGWFENESVWLHMSYKYLIELLRCGLHEEFFRDARTMLVPFMDPAVYGRSVLENSSFIASSANPDPNTHGRGFIARLSGSTAEFIHIWLLLTAGERPFREARDGIRLQLEPVLPAAWFTCDAQQMQWRGKPADLPANALGCALLGDILLVYHNEERRDTFGEQAALPARYALDGQPASDGAWLSAPGAEAVRARRVRRLDVWLES